MRNLLLKCTFSAVLLTAALLLYSPFAGSSYAALGGCTVTCKNGTCSTDPDPGETCYCSCTWLTSSASCSCSAQLQPAPQDSPSGTSGA